MNEEDNEETKKRGLNVFHKVVTGMSFGRKLSNLERMHRDTKEGKSSGSGLGFIDDLDEDAIFELPETPLEIESQDSRVIGGLFPGKGFFYLPKTTCFDRNWAAEVQVGKMLQETLLRIDHSEIKSASLLESKSPARFVKDSLSAVNQLPPRVEPMTYGIPISNVQAQFNQSTRNNVNNNSPGPSRRT